MQRVIIICEGPTEQAFCRTTMQLPLLEKGIIIETPLIKHSRGGIVKWPTLKEQIEMHIKSDPTAYVTTFVDYYGMYGKHSFPDWDHCETIADHNVRMSMLEEAMLGNLSHESRRRFIPYLQLHEFEGLLFNDIQIFYDQIPAADLIGEDELVDIFNTYPNPELINNSRLTSPSHRLVRIIRGYNKVVYGDILAEAIGLTRIRAKCPRFNEWISKIEGLAA